MQKLRRIIFWCHLPVGVIGGLVIFNMCVTGVLLTYEKQITSWADTRNYRSAPPAPGAQHLPVETLIAKSRESRGGNPTAVTLKSDPSAPAEIAFGRETTLFVNPYTGSIYGEGSQRVRNFFRGVTEWHRWLGAKGENRNVPPTPRANQPAPASTNNQLDLANNLNSAWLRAEQQVTDWRSITMQLPASATTQLTFNIDSGSGGGATTEARTTRVGS